jgi:hypothetical protein
MRLEDIQTFTQQDYEASLRRGDRWMAWEIREGKETLRIGYIYVWLIDVYGRKRLLRLTQAGGKM